jgi:hypothetical protein
VGDGADGTVTAWRNISADVVFNVKQIQLLLFMEMLELRRMPMPMPMDIYL